MNEVIEQQMKRITVGETVVYSLLLSPDCITISNTISKDTFLSTISNSVILNYLYFVTMDDEPKYFYHLHPAWEAEAKQMELATKCSKLMDKFDACYYPLKNYGIKNPMKPCARLFVRYLLYNLIILF